jgi:hypothetical protein
MCQAAMRRAMGCQAETGSNGGGVTATRRPRLMLTNARAATETERPTTVRVGSMAKRSTKERPASFGGAMGFNLSNRVARFSHTTPHGAGGWRCGFLLACLRWWCDNAIFDQRVLRGLGLSFVALATDDEFDRFHVVIHC